MAKKTMLKLGTDVKELSTGLKGQLIHAQLLGNMSMVYDFQPKGLNAKTGEPLDGVMADAAEIQDGVEVPMPNLYEELMHSEVTDKASGFKGTVKSLVLHINGCVHARVQAKGVHPESGRIVPIQDFDIRRLKGPKVPVLTDEAKAADEKKHPSPAGLFMGVVTACSRGLARF